MPFPPVRCYRSLSWYVPCRLFPFRQLLCLFARFLHIEFACLALCLHTWLTPAGNFYFFQSKKYHASRVASQCYISQFSQQTKIHTLSLICSPARLHASLRFSLHTPMPIGMPTRKSALCDLPLRSARSRKHCSTRSEIAHSSLIRFFRRAASSWSQRKIAIRIAHARLMAPLPLRIIPYI